MPTDIMTPAYHTLEEIRQRKDQLSDSIEQDADTIGQLWGDLFAKKEDATKGEYVATLVANSITAIDAFLLVRKLMKNYSSVLSVFGRSKKRKRK